MTRRVLTEVTGNVWKVLVKPGDTVAAGDVLFILEVMKTEVPFEAEAAGVVAAVHISEGDEGVEEGVARGRQEADADWEAWYERSQQAARAGEPFDEPPPTRNGRRPWDTDQDAPH